MSATGENDGVTSATCVRQAVDDAFTRNPDRTGQLINVLNDLQETLRYVPEQAVELVCERMGVERDQVVRMCEFFNYLSLDPVGRCVIDVCDGTACHTQGSPRLIAEFEKVLGVKAGQTTADGALTLRTVGCVGACGIAPVVVVDEDAYGRVRIMQVPAIADSARERAEEAQESAAPAGEAS